MDIEHDVSRESHESLVAQDIEDFDNGQPKPSTTGCTRTFKIKSAVMVFTIILWIVSTALYGKLIYMLAHLAELCDSIQVTLAVLGLAHIIFIVLVGALAYKMWKLRSTNSFFPIRGPGKYVSIQAEDDDEITEIEMRHKASRASPFDKPMNVSVPCSWGRCLVTVLTSLLVFSLAVLIIANIIMFIVLFPRSIPGDLPDTVNHAALTAPVKIEYSNHGMIHITAETMDDAHFAQGMVTAQLRLWQMEFQRRVASGTLAALVGHDALDTDILMRTLNIRDAAHRAVTAVSPEARKALQSFADGVNAFLDTNPYLPIEFMALGASMSKWTPTDSMMWFKVMSLDLSGNMDLELQRFKLITEQNISIDRVNELLPKYDDDEFPTVLSEDDVQGSCTSPQDTYARMCTPSIERKYMDKVQGWSKSGGKRGHGHNVDEVEADLIRGIRAIKKWSPHIGGRAGLGASNNWVVHGNLTKAGKPLLCNDPHLQLLAPSIWILFHLEVATSRVGPLSLIGTTFVGAPGIVLGRNQYVAWGVTNTGADVQDLFVVEEPVLQQLGKNITERLEHFQISGRGDETRVMRNISGYGPIITDNGVHKSKYTLALKWVSIDPDVEDTTFDAFLGLNQATNYSDFRNALQSYVAPAQNFIFASTNGDIGYQLPGKIPVRQTNLTGMFPSLLNYSSAWTGYVNFTDLPFTKNPKKGYIVTANNRVVPGCFNTHISCDWDEGSDGYRAKRISQMIEERQNHTVASMKDIQLDYRSNMFFDFNTTLEKICSLNTSSTLLCNALRSWNGIADVGSTGATLFQKLYLELMKLPLSEVGDHYSYWSNPIYLKRAIEGAFNGTACGPNMTALECQQFASDATMAVANNVNIEDAPRWGQSVHKAEFTHEILNGSVLRCLANRQISHGGDDYTVNVGHYDYDSDDMTQGHGPSYRQIVDLANMERSVFLNPLGQYGMELNVHFDDLIDMWGHGKYMNMQTKRSAYGNTIVDSQTVKN